MEALVGSLVERARAWDLRRVWCVRIRERVALEDRVGGGGLERGGRPVVMRRGLGLGLEFAMVMVARGRSFYGGLVRLATSRWRSTFSRPHQSSGESLGKVRREWDDR